MTYYTKMKKKKKCPIGPASIRKGKFPKDIIQAMYYEVVWFKDVQTCERQGWILSAGAFVGGELYLSWMQFFPSPCLYSFFSLLLFLSFLFQGLITHEYFHRDDKAGS
jgi:hypothetical protein